MSGAVGSIYDSKCIRISLDAKKDTSRAPMSSNLIIAFPVKLSASFQLLIGYEPDDEAEQQKVAEHECALQREPN